MPGFVYILRKPLSPLTKIGISKTPKQREKDIERTTGTLYPGMVALVWNPDKLEKRLHRKYRKWRIKATKKNKRRFGSGYTEWFELAIWQRWAIRYTLLIETLVNMAPVVVLLVVVWVWMKSKI